MSELDDAERETRLRKASKGRERVDAALARKERECVTHHICDCKRRELERLCEEQEGTHELLAHFRDERRRLVGALAYLADPKSWLGNPHDLTATLHGHDTPYELARAVLDANPSSLVSSTDGNQPDGSQG